MDAINGVGESASNLSESKENSDSKSNSEISKKSDSDCKWVESVKESKSSKVQNDSEHTIGLPNSNSDSKFEIKSEQNLSELSFIQKETKEYPNICKNDQKQLEKSHSLKERK